MLEGRIAPEPSRGKGWAKSLGKTAILLLEKTKEEEKEEKTF